MVVKMNGSPTPIDVFVWIEKGFEIWNSYLTYYVVGVKKRRRGISCLQKTDKIILIPMRCQGTSKGNWFCGNILWNMYCCSQESDHRVTISGQDRFGIMMFPSETHVGGNWYRTSSRATILFTSAQLNSFSSPSRGRRICVEGCRLSIKNDCVWPTMKTNNFTRRLRCGSNHEVDIQTPQFIPHHPHIVCSLIHSLRWILIDISCKW